MEDVPFLVATEITIESSDLLSDAFGVELHALIRASDLKISILSVSVRPNLESVTGIARSKAQKISLAIARSRSTSIPVSIETKHVVFIVVPDAPVISITSEKREDGTRKGIDRTKTAVLISSGSNFNKFCGATRSNDGNLLFPPLIGSTIARVCKNILPNAGTCVLHALARSREAEFVVSVVIPPLLIASPNDAIAQGYTGPRSFSTPVGICLEAQEIVIVKRPKTKIIVPIAFNQLEDGRFVGIVNSKT